MNCLLAERVPIERLVSNLEERAKKAPKDAHIRFSLARVYGMAYAKKTNMLEILKGLPDRGTSRSSLV